MYSCTQTSYPTLADELLGPDDGVGIDLAQLIKEGELSPAKAAPTKSHVKTSMGKTTKKATQKPAKIEPRGGSSDSPTSAPTAKEQSGRAASSSASWMDSTRSNAAPSSPGSLPAAAHNAKSLTFSGLSASNTKQQSGAAGVTSPSEAAHKRVRIQAGRVRAQREKTDAPSVGTRSATMQSTSSSQPTALGTTLHVAADDEDDDWYRDS